MYLFDLHTSRHSQKIEFVWARHNQYSYQCIVNRFINYRSPSQCWREGGKSRNATIHNLFNVFLLSTLCLVLLCVAHPSNVCVHNELSEQSDKTASCRIGHILRGALDTLGCCCCYQSMSSMTRMRARMLSEFLTSFRASTIFGVESFVCVFKPFWNFWIALKLYVSTIKSFCIIVLVLTATSLGIFVPFYTYSTSPREFPTLKQTVITFYIYLAADMEKIWPLFYVLSCLFLIIQLLSTLFHYHGSKPFSDKYCNCLRLRFLTIIETSL